MNVDFALHVHEHQSPREADCDHHQLGPERPFQDPLRAEREEHTESETSAEQYASFISNSAGLNRNDKRNKTGKIRIAQ